ncbi:MAG: hypothetical protein WD851_01935 [Pirellulales bacterium]
MKFGLFLTRSGVIAPEQFISVLQKQQEDLVPLGQLAIEEGKLTVQDVFKVLRVQTDLPHDRFGETAVELGLLDKRDIAELLMVQSGRCQPFSTLLVEMGFLTSEQVDRELLAYRRGLERDGAAGGVRRVVRKLAPPDEPNAAQVPPTATNGHR